MGRVVAESVPDSREYSVEKDDDLEVSSPRYSHTPLWTCTLYEFEPAVLII